MSKKAIDIAKSVFPARPVKDAEEDDFGSITVTFEDGASLTFHPAVAEGSAETNE
jgi:hypothetical protein